MLSLAKTLDRRRFLLIGAALVVLKVLLDAAVARAFGKPFSLSFYLVPTGAPLFSPPAHDSWFGGGSDQASGYWLTVVGCTPPFVVLGVALTIRRLRDAGMSGLLALFFFVPFVKYLFFAVLAAAPTKAPAPQPELNAGPFRSAPLAVDVAPDSTSYGRRRLRALAVGTLAGDAVAARPGRAS